MARNPVPPSQYHDALKELLAEHGINLDDVAQAELLVESRGGMTLNVEFVDKVTRQHFGELTEVRLGERYEVTPAQAEKIRAAMDEQRKAKEARDRLELIDVLATGDGQNWSDFWQNPLTQTTGETMYGPQADEILASSWLRKQKGGWC